MAGSLTKPEQRIAGSLWIIWIIMVGMLAACDRSGSGDDEALSIPVRTEEAYITDQLGIAGKSLFLWSGKGGCKLQVNAEGSTKMGEKQRLKLTAPCYFVKSPGSQKVQIFQQDKVTRIVAVLGTPVVGEAVDESKRCGREVQGLIVNSSGKVRHSASVLSDGIYCAGQGLDNFQYALFYNS